MPKYTKKIQKEKDNKIIKDYIDSGFNQNEMAKRLGITQSAVSQRLARLEKTGTFSQILEEYGITDIELAKTMKAGLEATKVVGYLNNKTQGTEKVSDEFVEVPDHHCRHRYLETALEVKGHIRQNNTKANVAAVIINFGNKSGLFTEAQAEHISHQPGKI